MQDKMKMLWLDDLRDKPSPEWDAVRNYEEFTHYIKKYGMPDKISFDHDLGRPKTGYDCAVWLEREIATTIAAGKIIKIPAMRCHSANPAGRERIEAAIESMMRMK
jgi:hypothetical protein